MKAMRSFCLLVLVLMALSCKRTVVEGVTSVSVAGDSNSKVDDEAASKRREKSSKAKARPVEQTVTPHRGGRCLSRPADVRVVFVLDASDTMQLGVDLVRDQIMVLAKVIRTLEFADQGLSVASVDFAVITFRDQIDGVQRIGFGQTGQIPDLLHQIKAAGGAGDREDDGLKALLLALKTLAELPQHAEREFLPIVIAISDDFSHNGIVADSEAVVPARDCQVAWPPLVEQLGAAVFDHLMIYDATPQINAHPPGTGKCTAYAKSNSAPSRQWEDLRKLWLSSKPDRRATAIGRGLNFPITEAALLNVLTRDLQASFTACE